MGYRGRGATDRFALAELRFRTIRAAHRQDRDGSSFLRHPASWSEPASLLHRRRRGRKCRRRKPWLLAALSAVVMRRELRGKGTDQYLVGIGVDVNLFPSQSDGQVGGMGGQFAAGQFGGGDDFLLGGQHYFPNIFLGGFVDAAFLCFS